MFPIHLGVSGIDRCIVNKFLEFVVLVSITFITEKSKYLDEGNCTHIFARLKKIRKGNGVYFNIHPGARTGPHRDRVPALPVMSLLKTVCPGSAPPPQNKS